jgi:hypothetical protein
MFLNFLDVICVVEESQYFHASQGVVEIFFNLIHRFYFVHETFVVQPGRALVVRIAHRLDYFFKMSLRARRSMNKQKQNKTDARTSSTSHFAVPRLAADSNDNPRSPLSRTSL